MAEQKQQNKIKQTQRSKLQQVERSFVFVNWVDFGQLLAS